MTWKSFLQCFLAKYQAAEAADIDVVAAILFFDHEWPETFSSVDNDPSCVWNMDETGYFGELFQSKHYSRLMKDCQAARHKKTDCLFVLQHPCLENTCFSMLLAILNYPEQ